jgi:hypothetical protein
VRFDDHKYSVEAGAVGRPVEVRAPIRLIWADRIELRQGEPSKAPSVQARWRTRVVGEHAVVHRARTDGASMDDLRPGRDRLQSVAQRPGAGPQARRPAQRRPVQATLVLPAAIERVRERRCAPRRTATSGWSRSSAPCRPTGRPRSRPPSRRGAERGRPFRRRDPEHLGPKPRSGAAGHDHDARGAAPDLRADRRPHPAHDSLGRAI